MLELRLHTHNSAVDWFVIVESIDTFSGHPKTLFFDITNPRVRPFARKIRYILVSDMPNNGDPWKNEHHQRDAVTRAMWDAQPLDLVLISDCDEIVKPNFIIEAVNQTDFDVFGFQQPLYYCYFNNRMTGNDNDVDRIWSVAVRYYKLKEQSATWYRGHLGTQPYFWYANAGWHYSYMGDTSHIQNKIASFSHQELNTSQLKNALDPQQSALAGKDLLGRDWCQWTVLPVDQVDLPLYVRENMCNYQKYVIDYNEYLKYQAGLAQR